MHCEGNTNSNHYLKEKLENRRDRDASYKREIDLFGGIGTLQHVAAVTASDAPAPAATNNRRDDLYVPAVTYVQTVPATVPAAAGPHTVGYDAPGSLFDQQVKT